MAERAGAGYLDRELLKVMAAISVVAGLVTGVVLTSVRRKTRKLLILQGVTVYF